MLKYLILVYDPLHDDHASHAGSVYGALTKSYPHIVRLDINAVLELDTILEQVMQIAAEANTPFQVIVLGIGEKGLHALEQLEEVKRNSPEIMIAASLDEYSGVIRTLQQKRVLDLISIPEASLDN